MKYLKILYGLIFTLSLYFLLYKSGVVEYFDYKFFDIASYIVKNEPKDTSSSVIVVDIDEKSLKYLGQWPWSRLVLAKLVETISESKPTNIGFDIFFPEKDKTSLSQIEKFFKNYYSQNIKISGVNRALFDNDRIFANAIKEAGVTMPVYLSNQTSSECYIPKKNLQNFGKIRTLYHSEYMLCNLDILQKNSQDIGFVNAQEDSDGILRRVTMFIKYKNYYIPSFALANLMTLDSLKVKNSTVSILNHNFKMDRNSNIMINAYDRKWFKTISAVDILSGQFDKNSLLGKFVLIGTSAMGLHDRYKTSISAKNIPGIFIHATIIDNILNDTTIYQPQSLKTISLTISLLLSIVLLILMFNRYYTSVSILFVGISVIYFATGLFFLKNFIYISIGYLLAPYFIFFFFLNIISVAFHYKERKIFFEELTNAHSDTIDSMALVAETRDPETGAHILRTKEYMRCLVDYLGTHHLYKNIITKDYKEIIYRATPLHDIGKVGVPDYILKKPGKLENDEYEIMKQHSEIGKNIIENAMKQNSNNLFLKIAYNIAYFHHEKWDGTGYPCGIKKEEIPLESRMMALVDVYDALISKRYYKKSFTYEESEEIIIRGSGTHFDPILVGVFIELKDQFRKIAEEIK